MSALGVTDRVGAYNTEAAVLDGNEGLSCVLASDARDVGKLRRNVVLARPR